MTNKAIIMSQYDAILQMLRGLQEDIAALRVKRDKDNERLEIKLDAINEQVTTNKTRLSLITASIAIGVTWLFNWAGLGK